MSLQFLLRKTVLDHLFMYIGSVLIVCFLFYIDEGYYTLVWMKEPLAWLGVLLTAGFMFSGQVFAYHLLLGRFEWFGKAILSFILGLVLTVGGFFGFIWLITRG